MLQPVKIFIVASFFGGVCAVPLVTNAADDSPHYIDGWNNVQSTPTNESAIVVSTDKSALAPLPHVPPVVQIPIVDAEAAKKEMQQRLTHALKKLEHEPSVDAVIAAALKYGQANIETGRIWQRHVKRAPLLPTLKVSLGYDLERDESLDRYQNQPDRWGADTDNDLGFQVTAQWELDKLIFNPDELKVYNARADRAQRREAIISLIVGYYFERRRLQLLEAVQPETDLEKQIARQIRLKELTVVIDALTGGVLAFNL